MRVRYIGKGCVTVSTRYVLSLSTGEELSDAGVGGEFVQSLAKRSDFEVVTDDFVYEPGSEPEEE